MSYPIPAPRRPLDPRPKNPFRAGPPGPICASCAHRTCRAGRARTLPRLGGHRTEFVPEHRQAAQMQAHPSPTTTLNGHLRRSLDPNPHLMIFFGEATQSFWVASTSGMVEARTLDDLLTHLWTHH
ncbi:hypothetical protein ACWGSK_01575 [Nocardiopsis sp. NPDC055551]